MNDHDNGKIMLKSGRILTKLASVVFSSVEIDDEQEVISKDIPLRIEHLLSNNFDGENMDPVQYMRSEDIGNNAASFHMIDKRGPNMNGKKLLEQKQTIPAGGVFDNTQNDVLTRGHRVVEDISQERNFITANLGNSIKTDITPIAGYIEEPLLPLSKACSPLNSILYNLPFYIHMALEETSEQPPDGLTIDESAAIRLYTIEWEPPHRSLYSMLNYVLKNEDREHLRPYFRYLKLFLTALVKLPCARPLTVWRGVTKDLSNDFPPGTSVTWWAFSSCTTELTVLENNMYLGSTGSRTLFSVEAINGRTIQNHSHFVTEDEILLLPGTQMIVQSQFSPAAGLHIVHLKQVIPVKMLLEPPFQGIVNIFDVLI